MAIKQLNKSRTKVIEKRIENDPSTIRRILNKRKRVKWLYI